MQEDEAYDRAEIAALRVTGLSRYAPSADEGFSGGAYIAVARCVTMRNAVVMRRHTANDDLRRDLP